MVGSRASAARVRKGADLRCSAWEGLGPPADQAARDVAGGRDGAAPTTAVEGRDAEEVRDAEEGRDAEYQRADSAGPDETAEPGATEAGVAATEAASIHPSDSVRVAA